MILADTDVLIDYFVGVEPVTARVAACVQSDGLRTTAITCFELLTRRPKGNGETRFGAC